MKIDSRTEHLYLNLQGFNRIAAIALLFLNEEDAFWLLVYIVDVVMPLNYYTKQLIGAQVDQAVFKELVTEKLPNLAEHLGNFHFFFISKFRSIILVDVHGVDPALFSLNWFLCLFVDTLPVGTYLHIWDAFLFEGSKVSLNIILLLFNIIWRVVLRVPLLCLFRVMTILIRFSSAMLWPF